MNLQSATSVKEDYEKRNYLALMLDGFFFSFSASIFSYTTVLPVYVSHLSDNPMYVSMLAVLYFGLSNGSALLSCVLGVNTRSPKWSTVWICFTQRFGFLLILVSTFVVTGSREAALAVFFVSYGIYGVAAGMSGPLHSLLVSTSISKNIGSFYGSYNLAGALGGVVGAQLMRVILERFSFPVNYSRLFTVSLAAAVFSTLSLAIFIQEEKRPAPEKKLHFADLPGVFRKIITTNRPFRRFLCSRLLVCMADMAVPYYIIRIQRMDRVTEGFVGTMSTVLLLSNMVASKVLGYVGDRKGPMAMLMITAASGVGACLCALWMNSPRWGFLLFVLVSFANMGMMSSNSVAIIRYADEGLVPVYHATSGVLIAPFYAFFSFLGGIISRKFSIMRVFGVSAVLYLSAVVIIMVLHQRGMAKAETHR